METGEEVEANYHSGYRLGHHRIDDVPDRSDEDNGGEDLGSIRYPGNFKGERTSVRLTALRSLTLPVCKRVANQEKI